MIFTVRRRLVRESSFAVIVLRSAHVFPLDYFGRANFWVRKRFFRARFLLGVLLGRFAARVLVFSLAESLVRSCSRLFAETLADGWDTRRAWSGQDTRRARRWRFPDRQLRRATSSKTALVGWNVVLSRNRAARQNVVYKRYGGSM